MSENETNTAAPATAETPKDPPAQDDKPKKGKKDKAAPAEKPATGQVYKWGDEDEFFIPGKDDGGPEELVEVHAGRLTGLVDGLTDSVDKSGIKKPIVVVKDGGKMWILDGVQRFRALKDVNTVRRSEKKPVLRVPYTIEVGLTPTERFTLALQLNNFVREDPPLLKSKKAAALLRTAIKEGRSQTQATLVVAEAFGISKSLVDGLVKLHEASAEVKAALDQGNINQSVAIELAHLPVAEQALVLKQAEDAGEKLSTSSARNKVRATKGAYEKGNVKADRVLLKAIVKAHVEKKIDYMDKAVINAIRLSLQQVDIADVWGTIKGVKDSIRYVTTPAGGSGKKAE